ncbi:class I SAM-dependent methyltransferase [Mesorhizobium sp.]|uniref:class I SAM-dependent methyltransferase n=1 Tax=Mesorhizobium sp. TaxID=1871066 RepID=UPI0025BDF320|nr:class I SAM-dependent methyltransferase [Mesorhizobium sp.]
MSISDRQTASGQAALERIKASLALDCNAVRLAHFYRGWARSYDLDVGSEEYREPTAKDREATEILDAGCGAGIVGGQLKRLGFQVLDGFDLSDERPRRLGKLACTAMSKAMSTNGPLSNYPSASYDITVCCGVFTLGHVRPDGVRELACVTRSNSFVIKSTRKSYAEEHTFETRYDVCRMRASLWRCIV